MLNNEHQYKEQNYKLRPEDFSTLKRYFGLIFASNKALHDALMLKLSRVSHFYGSDGDVSVIEAWLDHIKQHRERYLNKKTPINFIKRNFDWTRDGITNNPIYQAYLDTLEQHELDAIEDNAGYIFWNMMVNNQYVQSTKASGRVDYYDFIDYAIQFSKRTLSNRIKSLPM